MKRSTVGKGLCVHRRVMMHKMCANLKDCEVGTYVIKTVGQTLRTVDTRLTHTPKLCLAKPGKHVQYVLQCLALAVNSVRFP